MNCGAFRAFGTSDVWRPSEAGHPRTSVAVDPLPQTRVQSNVVPPALQTKLLIAAGEGVRVARAGIGQSPADKCDGEELNGRERVRYGATQVGMYLTIGVQSALQVSLHLSQR